MARLPYPDPQDLSPENRELMASLPPLNVFRMMSGAGASFAPFMQFISAYLNDGVLPPDVRELVILRVGHLCGSHRSEEHTSELQSRSDLVCRLLLEKKKGHNCIVADHSSLNR